ncbi:MAG: DNA polymerase III subunits gamma and tau [Candidatus Carbobacillus altaicus]|uniref:DNA-directed DNA polymerase n=1 Tax=Candidatus Carbonibacillus altaicus TaxID=2163959 RepID=A0A2R6Y200_9BACL|nr:MAG: DNA polymerase III subunits gamma and tau [Candidatus Carbobacillus altaicus]
MYRALYLTYRPQTFADLAGQTHIAETLRHAVKTKKFAHAYLFSGSRGTGKTTAARILAKAINCLSPLEGEPCLSCEHCQLIEQGETLDVLELDAASNRGIEDIRTLRDATLLRPSKLPYKVYIIDEVHMLTQEAANALLKTLEEPPDYVVFILATTDPQKLPATIVSRTQRFDFKRLLPDVIQSRLQMVAEKEGIKLEAGAIRLLSVHAEGGMRDALALLDQARAFAGETITKAHVEQLLGIPQDVHIEALLQAIETAKLQEISRILQEMYADGRDAVRILTTLMQAMRERVLGQKEHEQTQDRFDATRRERLLTIMTQMLTLEPLLRRSYDPFLFLEVGLIKASAESHAPSATGSTIKQADGDGVHLKAVEKAASTFQTKASGSNQKTSESIEPPSERTLSAHPGETSPSSRKTTRREQKGVWQSGSTDKLIPFLDEVSLLHIQSYQSRWSELLNRIKAYDIRTEAWFKQGTPAAVHEDMLLIVFSKALHRETVEKEEHRIRIEQALADVFGRPLKFMAVMEEDWLRTREEVRSGKKAEAMVDGSHEDPLVREAIELVGEAYVEVIDRRKKG